MSSDLPRASGPGGAPETSEHDDVTASSPPITVRLEVPAESRYLAALRHLVSASLACMPGDGQCRTDVTLAADEVAAVLVGAARPGSVLEVGLLHDDADVYVRVRAQTSAARPRVGELTQILLEAVAESIDVWMEGDHAYAVLQRPLARDGGGEQQADGGGAGDP